MLPLSLAEDLGDSEDEDDNAGWGSDFDESARDVVDESEIYEIIGEPRDDCGDVSLVSPIKFCFFTWPLFGLFLSCTLEILVEVFWNLRKSIFMLCLWEAFWELSMFELKGYKSFVKISKFHKSCIYILKKG